MTDQALINTVAATAIPPAYKVVYGSGRDYTPDVVKFAANVATAKKIGSKMLKAARDEFSEPAWRPFLSVTGANFDRLTEDGGMVIIYDQALRNEKRPRTL